MRLENLIEILQQKDEGYIVLINSGAFYLARGRDAILLNKILDLRLTCMKANICKVGFPRNSLEKYKNIIKRKRYAYIIYNIDREKDRLEVIEKFNGKLKNEIKEDKRDCYICKNPLRGYTEKEDKYTKALADLYRREQDARK